MSNADPLTPRNKIQIRLQKCINLIKQDLIRSDSELDNLKNTEFVLENLLNSQPVTFYVQNKDQYKNELDQNSYYWE